MLKGAFSIDDKDYPHLINWIKTAAFTSQREKKSKTYIVFHDNKPVAYTTLSSGILEQNIDGVANTTSFSPQILLLGKLYVSPECRSSGVGSKLLSFVLDIAVNLDEMVGCIGIMLDANNNERTISFYRRFGFVEISQDPSEQTVRMFFKLPNLTLSTAT